MPKIDTVKDDQTGVSVDIHLNKKSLEFSAEFADFSITDKDGDKVRREVIKAIRERAALVWTPVIYAVQAHQLGLIVHENVIRPEEQREQMNLEIERFYVARKADGRWIRAEWDCPVDQRMSRTKWANEIPDGASDICYTIKDDRGLPYGRPTIKGKYLLPYDESLWNGLLEVIWQMKGIRELVVSLLSNEQGIAQLSAIGNGIPLLKSDRT